MASLFTRIIQGEIPCHKLYEDDHAICFLDIRPINPGHALVVTKVEIDDFFALDDAVLQHLIVVAKKVAQAIEQTVSCNRVGLMVAGLEVPHAHLHLVPINGLGDLNFARAIPAAPADLSAMAAAIREHLSA
jgi:histidine triad (HIT) family protein